MAKIKKIKLSQSLIKAMYQYQNKEKCGLQIKAQYLDNVEFPSSDAMDLGNYFEYICTGSLARNGSTPEAQTTKKGEPTAKYKIMNDQKKNYEAIMSEYGFKLLSIDHHFKSKDYSGIADVIAERNGEKCIIDIKTTGLIDDKWSPYGWHNDSLPYNDNLLIQARHYKMLAEEEWGIVDIPFYFFVFSTTNSIDFKVIEVIGDELSLDMHRRNSEGAKEIFDKLVSNGFKAYPSLKACSTCPLAENCESFAKVPEILTIQC